MFGQGGINVDFSAYISYLAQIPGNKSRPFCYHGVALPTELRRLRLWRAGLNALVMFWFNIWAPQPPPRTRGRTMEPAD